METSQNTQFVLNMFTSKFLHLLMVYSLAHLACSKPLNTYLPCTKHLFQKLLIEIYLNKHQVFILTYLCDRCMYSSLSLSVCCAAIQYYCSLRLPLLAVMVRVMWVLKVMVCIVKVLLVQTLEGVVAMGSVVNQVVNAASCWYKVGTHECQNVVDGGKCLDGC